MGKLKVLAELLRQEQDVPQTTGQIYTASGSYCALGAIGKACGAKYTGSIVSDHGLAVRAIEAKTGIDVEAEEMLDQDGDDVCVASYIILANDDRELSLPAIADELERLDAE